MSHSSAPSAREAQHTGLNEGQWTAKFWLKGEFHSTLYLWPSLPSFWAVATQSCGASGAQGELSPAWHPGKERDPQARENTDSSNFCNGRAEKSHHFKNVAETKRPHREMHAEMFWKYRYTYTSTGKWCLFCLLTLALGLFPVIVL